MEADEIERLLVRVEANAAQFEGQMKRINKALYGSAAEVRKTQAQIKRDMDRAWNDFGSSFARPVQAASTLALAAIVGFSIKAAKRAEAVDGAFEQTFRKMPERANKAVTAIATDFQRLETDIKDRATQMQAVMTALGVDAEQALSIVDALSRRSLDMAAFKDVEDAEAFRAVLSGITGETEPLKKFGVVLNETAVKAELMRLGFKGNASEASEAAKAIARTNIILQRTKEMEGQVSREAETLSEQQKRANTTFTQAAEAFGKQFLPVAKDVLIWATDALKAFNDLPTGVQNASLALLAFVAASGPIGAAIKGLQALIAAATAARVALAGVAGSGASSAAAGAAGASAGLVARAVPMVGAAAATLSLSGDTQRPGARIQNDYADLQALKKSQADYAAQAASEEQRGRAGMARMYREAAARAAARAADTQERIAASERAQLESQAAAAATNQARAAGTATAGDFGLSAAQKKATGIPTPGGGGGSSDAAARQLAERREALALERAIDLARASGDAKAIAAAEERQTLARLTADYQAAGYTDAEFQATAHLALLNQAVELTEERARAEKEAAQFKDAMFREAEQEADALRSANDLLLDQLSMRAQLADLRGDHGALRSIERELWIEERINTLLQLRKGMTRVDAKAQATGEADAIDAADARGRFRDLVVQAGTDFGSLVEDAGDRFKRRALEGLADVLFDIVSKAFNGAQGGGSGFIASLLKAIPGFATGTSSAPGGLSYVHAGEVLTNLKPGTKVIPAHAVRAMGAMVGAAQANPVRGGSQTVHHVVTVVPDRDSFVQLAADTAQPMAEMARSGAVGDVASAQAVSNRRAQLRTRR